MSTDYRFGVLGRDIAYSKSPQIFRVILSILGATGDCDVIDIEPDRLASTLERLKKSNLCGLSVTIPYKQAVIEHLVEVDPIGRTLDAVNSIKIDRDGLHGYNTDAYGFSLSLRSQTERLTGGRALILGCGGAAAAVICALANDFGVSELIVVGRSTARLDTFRGRMSWLPINVRFSTELTSDFDFGNLNEIAIIVNCTPLGGPNNSSKSPFPAGFKWPRQSIYYDLSYNAENPLVAAARAAGLTALDGSAMLVAQAIRSFELWTGRSVGFEPVYEGVFGDREAT